MAQTTKEMTKTDEFIQEAEAQFNDWLDHFNRLEEHIKDAGSDVEEAYQERIDDLRNNLRDIEIKLDDLRSSDPEHWDERKYRFQQASWTYEQSYTTLFNDMKQDENRSAGWLEGFTDRPPAGSAGWLEGTDTKPMGSEGWVEGMAERGPKSEGWTEGYTEDKSA